MKSDYKTIVIVFNSLDIGGIENKIVDITNHLTTDYPDIKVVLCLKNSGGPLTSSIPPQITISSPQKFPSRYFNAVYFPIWLTKIFKKYSPDTVLSLGNYSAICSQIAIKHAHIKTRSIISEDSSIINQIKSDSFSFLRKLLIKHTYHFANSIIVLSTAGEKNLLRLIPGLKSKVIVIPIWLSSKYQPPIILPEKDIDILFLGRFVIQKNPLRFVKIIKLLTKYYPSIHCLMVGSGPLLETTKYLIKKLKLSTNIQLLPATTSPSQYYLRSHFFLLTSRHEGFPAVLLEAHTYRCLPIIKHLPELDDFYQKSHNYLFFNTNVQAVQNIRFLASHPQITHSLITHYYNQVIHQRSTSISTFYKLLLNQ